MAIASIAQLFLGGGKNNGLEGIAVVASTGAIFVLKEKRPRLMLELSPDLTTIRGNLVLSSDLGFACKGEPDDSLDTSGIAYDAGRKAFWIASDTGKCLFLFDPIAKTMRAYPLTWNHDGRKRRVKQAEGVALSADGKTLFIVTDDGTESRLFRYAVE